MPGKTFMSGTTTVGKVLRWVRSQRHGCTLKMESRNVPCNECVKLAKSLEADVESMLRLAYLKGHDDGSRSVAAEPDRGVYYALSPYYDKL